MKSHIGARANEVTQRKCCDDFGSRDAVKKQQLLLCSTYEAQVNDASSAAASSTLEYSNARS